jgi:pyruvate dehydrogenase E1 component beta subunit
MTFNFALQSIDHIINSAAKSHYMSGGDLTCPIVFRGPNGASAAVAAQHSQCFISWYSSVPGLIVLAPYHARDYVLDIGKGHIERQGTDVTIVAMSKMVKYSL